MTTLVTHAKPGLLLESGLFLSGVAGPASST